MKIAPHYQLIKDHPASFELHDKRDGRSFHVAKKGMSQHMLSSMGKIQKFAEGGVAAPEDNTIPYDKLIPQEQAQNAPYLNPEDVAGLRAEAPAQISDSAGPQPESPPMAAADGPPRAPDEANVLAASEMTGNKSLMQERGTMQAASKAEQTAARDTSNMEALANVQRDVDTDELKQSFADRMARNDSLMKAYSEKTIDPDHYWHSKSTGSKISAGLGMILGGLGAGSAGQPNMAMQTINGAIERDMEAQRADQSKAANLWKMNREATSSDMEARLSFMNQALTGVKAKAQEFAARAGGPIAAARYAPLINDLNQQINRNTLHGTLLSASGSGRMIDIDPAHLLSSIPPAQQAVAAKEIETAQKMKALQGSVEQNVNDLKSKFLNGLLSPHDRESAIDSFASQMDVLSDHRFNLEASKLKGHAFFPAPGDSEETVKNKDRRRNEFFRDQVQSPVFKGATGVGLDRFRSTNIDQESAGPKMQTMGGVQYIRVPGGWKRAS